MKYRLSEETSFSILSVLIEKKECAQHDLPKEVKKDYHTVLRHLQTLEKDGYIHLVRTEPAEKEGEDRKIYELTFNGLILVLKKGVELYSPLVLNEKQEETNREIEEELIQVTANHKDKLPLIFGKWHFFNENSIRDIIVRRFICAIQSSHLLSSLASMHELEQESQSIQDGHLSEKENEQFSTELYGEAIDEVLKEISESNVSQGIRDLNNRTFGILSVVFHDKRFIDEIEESMFLLRVLRKDIDLRAYIDNELNETEKEYAQYLLHIWAWKQILMTS